MARIFAKAFAAIPARGGSVTRSEGIKGASKDDGKLYTSAQKNLAFVMEFRSAFLFAFAMAD